jgi:WD40-like Beta Propeller Repeat
MGSEQMTKPDLDATIELMLSTTLAPFATSLALSLALLAGAGCSFDASGLDPTDLGLPVDAPRDLSPSLERAQDMDPRKDLGLDASTIDVGDTDVDPAAPFGPPTPVTPLNTSSAGEDDPTLTGDMLEIYYNRGEDIWVSTRSKLTAAWSAPQPEASLSSASTETNPEITPAGLTIFFASTRPHPDAKGSYDIFVSTRASRSAAWSAPTPVKELNTAGSDHAGPAPDLLTMIVISDTGALGAHDLLISTRPSTSSPWSAPAPLSTLNTSAQESSAWLDASATLLYYASSRQAANHDIYLSARPGPGQPFGAPLNLTSLNSPDTDEDPWLSPDLRTIYFSSTRSGTNDLYVATR